MRRTILTALGLAAGCGPTPCGDAGYVTGGEALATWDVDGDGVDADLVERCGANWGSFGLRRGDVGLTELVLDPSVPDFDFEAQLHLSSVLLPAASLVFLTEHLAVGETFGMEALAGGGLHHLGGEITDVYTSYLLLDAEVRVLDGPKPARDTVGELSNTESWLFAWTASFGDPASGAELQAWDAEDWIDVSDGTEVGDPLWVPPDAVL